MIISILCLEMLPGESLFSLKRAWQHGLALQSCISTKLKTCGTMSFRQMRPLTLMHRAMFGENKVQHISTKTSYQLWSTVVEGSWFALVLPPQALSRPWICLITKVLQSLLSSVRQVQSVQNWVIQQDNDPKHTCKVLLCSNQSPQDDWNA